MRTVLPGWIFPAFSASVIRLTPIRSFTLEHGLKLSSFASTVALLPFTTLLSCTSGVRPISSVTSFATFITLNLLQNGSMLCVPSCLLLRAVHHEGHQGTQRKTTTLKTTTASDPEIVGRLGI